MKRIVGIILVCIMLFTLCACGQTTPAESGDTPAQEAAAEPITLSVAHINSEEHPYGMGCTRFKELVEEKSNGLIQIDLYRNGELGTGAKAVEACQMGAIDIVLESQQAISNFAPEFNVLALPFLFEDRDIAFKVLDGEYGAKLAGYAENVGIKILYYWDNGYRNISNSKRAINSLEDMKGLKIRVPESAIFIDTFTALGCVPTPMAWSEVFSAIQLGTVDGQENPNSTFVLNKLYEIQDYYAVTGHQYTAEPLMVNMDVWKSLSADQQAILLDAAKEAGDYERQLNIDLDEDYLQECIDQGMTVTYPDVAPFREAVKPVMDAVGADYPELYKELMDLIQ